tara:strand:+ start:1360 stop:1656 length:297 start_codon:yes stop_codon:yes gene_type:complete
MGSGERKLTSSERKAKMLLPWIDQVVRVGEEVTAKQVIEKLCADTSPVRRIGQPQTKGVYRNLKYIPNTGSMSRILDRYDRYRLTSDLGKVKVWRRVK